MQTAAAPRLERHRIFHSRDPEETRAFLAHKNFWLDFPKGRNDREPLDAHVNGVYLPGMYIGYFGYGRSTVVKATPARTDYWVQLPIYRRFELTVRGHRVVYDRQRAAVLSPMNENAIRSEAGCGRLVFSLTGDTVVRQLSALLGRALDAPPVFDHTLSLDTGYGQSLIRYMRTAVQDLEQNDSLLHSPLAISLYGQFVVTGLLLSHPHNYTNALLQPGKSIAPRDVKRAIDFIDAHLGAPIGLADVVAAVGVPGRTLSKHFRDFTGLSPIAYLRGSRFERVREALRQAPPEGNVSTIAARWGFDHLGRFAVEYRRRFGEKPSETLARHRAGIRPGRARRHR